MSLSLLLLLFPLVAVCYAMVGFGGGSSYLALLAMSDLDHDLWRPIALICNLAVVSGGTYLYVKRGHFSPRLFVPFVVSSVPAAWLGGMIRLERTLFLVLLGGCLLLAGVRMLVDRRLKAQNARKLEAKQAWAVGLPAGALLGGVSGLVGIGGGIFLAPILYMLGWGKPKQIAATSSAFILVNSLAALGGYLVDHGGLALPDTVWALPLAVLVAGQVGSRLGSGLLPAGVVRALTAVLVLVVGSRLLWQALGLG